MSDIVGLIYSKAWKSPPANSELICKSLGIVMGAQMIYIYIIQTRASENSQKSFSELFIIELFQLPEFPGNMKRMERVEIQENVRIGKIKLENHYLPVSVTTVTLMPSRMNDLT